MIVVIHGPMATGKTMHAARFAEHYGATRIIEDENRPHRYDAKDGDLILSLDTPNSLYRRYPAAVLIGINTARAAIGLGPAPTGGYFARG